MKFDLFLIAIIGAILVALTSALPTPHEMIPTHGLLVEEPEDIAPEAQPLEETFANIEPERSDRNRRATCDLLSISLPWGSVNHAACAAHCIAMRKGYKGGRCRDGVCHCRR